MTKTTYDEPGYKAALSEQKKEERAGLSNTFSGDIDQTDNWTEKNDAVATLLKSDLKSWNTDALGSKYWPTTYTEQTIKPGLYKPAFNNEIGFYLQKMKLTTDFVGALKSKDCIDILEEVKVFWASKAKYKAHGSTHKRGIMLKGEPGTGKSTLIYAIINLMVNELKGIVVFATSNTEALEACVLNIRKIEPLREICLILEDFDTLISKEDDETIYMNLLDGESSVDDMLTIATTNNIEKINRRFVDRPSRFDLIKLIKKPGTKSRYDFLVKKFPSYHEAALAHMAQDTKGFTYAHLKELSLCMQVFDYSFDAAVARIRKLNIKDQNNEDGNMDEDNIGVQGTIGFKVGGRGEYGQEGAMPQQFV